MATTDQCPACGGILGHCVCGQINLTNETIVMSDRDEVTRLRARLSASESALEEARKETTIVSLIEQMGAESLNPEVYEGLLTALDQMHKRRAALHGTTRKAEGAEAERGLR